MSVIIPNMKMPMSCLVCPLAREMFGCLVCVGYFKDSLTGRRVYKSDLKESDADFNRPDWCPLVPLSEGHGRLIDADALMEIIRAHDYPLTAHFNSTDNGMFTLGIQQAVNESPTIVPAEGGGEE